MENIYYIVPISDSSIINYSELVEIKPTLLGVNYFICKTYLGIDFDLLMDNYPRFTSKEILIELSKEIYF